MGKRSTRRLCWLVPVVLIASLFAGSGTAQADPPLHQHRQLRNADSNMCLVVQWKAGAQAFQFDCGSPAAGTDWADQYWQNEWQYSIGDAQYYKIRNYHSGLCLAATSFQAGNRPVQSSCNTSSTFIHWRLHTAYLGSGSFQMSNAASGYCLTNRGVWGNGAPIYLDQCVMPGPTHNPEVWVKHGAYK